MDLKKFYKKTHSIWIVSVGLNQIYQINKIVLKNQYIG